MQERRISTANALEPRPPTPAHRYMHIYIHTYTPIYKHISCIGTITWAFDIIIGIVLMYKQHSENIYHVCSIPRYSFDIFICFPPYPDRLNVVIESEIGKFIIHLVIGYGLMWNTLWDGLRSMNHTLKWWVLLHSWTAIQQCDLLV